MASGALFDLIPDDFSQLQTLDEFFCLLAKYSTEDISANLIIESDQAVSLSIAGRPHQVRSSVVDDSYRVLHFEPIAVFDLAKADFLSQALDSVEQGLVVLDENRQVIALNNIALAMGGWLKVDILGKTFFRF